MDLAILPLAITMMAGPQIMSAIVFVTSDRAVPVSLGFLAGVTIATTAGVAIAAGIASLLHDQVSLGDPSDKGSTGQVIQYVLVALLVAFALKNYLGRETVEPPKWLGALQRASPGRAFVTGLLIILLMPSDIVVLLTVGTHLEHSGDSFTAALPFIGATILIAALPFLAFLAFHRRAERAMPRVRDWMNSHSWLVNVFVCGVFIVLIL